MSNNRSFWRRTGRWLALGVLVTLGVLLGPFQQRLAQTLYEAQRPLQFPPETLANREANSEPVPEAQEPETDSTPALAPPTQSAPDAINLAVPFTAQAPHGNWDADHEEYCEEASALMAARFFQNQPIHSPDEAENALAELKAWQLHRFGYFESTTAAETAEMIRSVYALTAEIQNEVTADTIKYELAQNHLVLLPAAGRELGNPYFQRPGPVYHMLVVKGYTADGQFITNDPGTRRGADFVYDEDQLLDAVGDYNHGDPANGPRAMIVVSPAY